MVVSSIVAETLFCDILRKYHHQNDFKYVSINFDKQRKQPEIYQNLSIAPLISVMKLLNMCNIEDTQRVFDDFETKQQKCMK